MLATLLFALAAAAQPALCTLPDGATITLELALTEDERGAGLMFRDYLAPDRGMFFVFDEQDRWPFWMKNTFIPLDIVWLSGDGTVVDVRAGAEPCRSDPCPSYLPSDKAWAVLEINAGLAAKHGLKAGQRVRTVGVPKFPVAGDAK